ncbi:spermatogenesis- and oogenesis-specific basic helix-loop-helix-containing protein 1 [Saccopteryx bilineata]|uniref:spermatogenesis- and oogenesis-specific basic helix-loop-helix-containing protein 1 n=1 Tax=Saccopteryx bilineata TaxID=59482 RepID=UPI00338E28D4
MGGACLGQAHVVPGLVAASRSCVVMESQNPQPSAGAPHVPVSKGCRGSSSPTGAQLHCEDPAGRSSDRVKNPAVAEGPASYLSRNVLAERERRKRISVSCERLRALLPKFSGRREDMASVLEMSVQFLQFVGTMVPSGEQQHAAHAPSKEAWRYKWHKNQWQVAPVSETPAGVPDPRTEASMTMEQDPVCCAAIGADQAEAPAGVAQVLDGPVAFPGPSSLVAWTPDPSLRPPAAWPACPGQPPSPLVSEEAQSYMSQAGPPAEEPDQAVMPGTRSGSGCDAEDGPSFLLTANPDWWLGPLEGKGSSAASQAPARSSLLDRTEPGFLGDPDPSYQELPDSPMEPWGWDTGCTNLALRDEPDNIFPDFFAY